MSKVDLDELEKQGAVGSEEEEGVDKPPKKPSGPSATEKALAAQLEEERKRGEKMQEILRAVVAGGKKNEEDEEEEDDFDIVDEDDEDDEDQIKQKKAKRARINPEKVKKSVQDLVAREAQKYAGSLTKALEQQQNMTLSLAHQQQRASFEDKMGKLGLSDVVDEVDEYIKSNGIQLSQLVSPGAYDMLASAVLGAREITNRAKASNLPSAGSRRSREDEEEEAFSTVNPTAVATFNDRYGFNLETDELKVLSGNEVKFSDYANFVTTKARRKRSA